MTEVFNFRFGGPGADGVAGCKEILLHSTQALLVSITICFHISNDPRLI